MDPESLQTSSRRSPSCFNVFVVLSIIFLTVAVAAVAAVGIVEVNELRSKQPLPIFDTEVVKRTGQPQLPDDTMKKFAYVEAISRSLENSTMRWKAVHYGSRVSVGSNFHFDSEQHSLKPLKAGSYYLYVELNFTCTERCEAAAVSVHVGNKLTCEVQLPEMAASRPVTKQCFTVSHLRHNESLLSHMTVPETGAGNWRLEWRGSRLGMFLVD